MIEETALITECDGEYAQVQPLESKACGTCAAKAGCGTAVLGQTVGNRQAALRVLNPIDAKPGERVVIGIQEAALTKASLAIYITPLIGLFLFALLGQWLSQWLGLASGELLSLGGGLLGLFAGIMWLRRFASRIDRDKSYHAVVLRRTGISDVPITIK